jgi:hypothetical protein
MMWTVHPEDDSIQISGVPKVLDLAHDGVDRFLDDVEQVVEPMLTADIEGEDRDEPIPKPTLH